MSLIVVSLRGLCWLPRGSWVPIGTGAGRRAAHRWPRSRGYRLTTANSCHAPSTPLSRACRGRRRRCRSRRPGPRPSGSTRISPAPAAAMTRAAMCTAIPPTSSPRSSTSPVCSPARIWSPSAAQLSRSAPRSRIARAGAVEGGQDAVAGGLDQRPPDARPAGGHELVVRVEQLAPAPVAQLGGPLGRADDVGEQHRRQHPVGLGRGGRRSGTPRPPQTTSCVVPAQRQVTRRSSTSLAPGMCSAR